MRKIDKFRMRMEESKKIYTQELERFSKRYDFLGDFTIVEEPDIDTVDYIYCFNSLNGTSDETLRYTRNEIYDHMIKFSETSGINEFSKNAFIRLKR